MEILVYDRANNKVIKEEIRKSLNFLYNTSLGRIILKIIINPTISKLNGLLIRSRLSKFKIKKFIIKNNINMEDYENVKYKSFDEFFTRKVKNGKRKICLEENILISPCDSKLMVYDINKLTCINVKNSLYTINELVRDKKIAHQYYSGKCLVFRLNVEDYHHYGDIDDGKVISTKEIKGVLHTINPIAFKRYKVFSENHRVVNIVETKNFGEIIYIEVGALNIGKINNYPDKICHKGKERGYFSFGASTIVLIFKENTIKIDDDILEKSKEGIETKILYGEKIGKKY